MSGHHHGKTTHPSTSDVDLAIASLVIYAALFPSICRVAWKHGKLGLSCWPGLATSLLLRFISTGWKISHRDDNVKRFNTAAGFTSGGIIGCLILSLVGVMYEVGTIIPQIASPRAKKAAFACAHVVVITALGIAAYGGRPKEGSSSQLTSPAAYQFSQCLILALLAAVGASIVWTGRRMAAHKDDVQFRNAKVMLFAAAVGLLFLSFRLIYATVYAFERLPRLDPDTGSLATKVILVLFPEMAVTLALLTGGWCSIGVGSPPPQTSEAPAPLSAVKVTTSV